MIISGRIDINDLDILNRRLIDYFGRGPQDLPYFRVIWGGDHYENRVMTHTDEGLELIHPEIRKVPKYWVDIRNKYILESLTIVPDYVETDLVDKLVYEPKFVFENRYGTPLYPRWDVMKTVLDSVRQNMEQAGKRGPYKDPSIGETPVETLLKKQAEIDSMQEYLYSDDTAVSDALRAGSGIVVPGPKDRD